MFLLAGMAAAAGEIPLDRLTPAARQFMLNRNQEARLEGVAPLVDGRQAVVGYLFRFQPAGFLVTSAEASVAPVYAWSPDGNLDLAQPEARLWKAVVTRDLQVRTGESNNLSGRERLRIEQQWREFLAGARRSPLFEQWPPEGTTYTGGWLETNWTQSAPYNNMCPMDLNTGSRSVAGCPATAMAQMINYHREIHGTRFNDDDDYYHNYGSGNSYWIDNDYIAWGFPCFDTLNHWLDSLEVSWEYGLSNPLKAALTFACGVAARQVYSSSASGTFGLEQAVMAWQRFGFWESRLVYPDDTTLNTLIADNVKAALPVQLGLLVSGGSGGHNVVVDGYNTDDFYHFNFGWGGSANGWYTLPPVSIPYNLTIIEGAVLDIKSGNFTGLVESPSFASATVCPNPFTDRITVRGISGPSLIILYDPEGREVMQTKVYDEKTEIRIGNLHPGCYLYRVTQENGSVSAGKVIKR